MLGLRHAHRRTVPVHVCRRSPPPPRPRSPPPPARQGLSCLTWSLPHAGAMMAWSPRPHKAGPRRNYRRAPSAVRSLFSARNSNVGTGYFRKPTTLNRDCSLCVCSACTRAACTLHRAFSTFEFRFSFLGLPYGFTFNYILYRIASL